MKGWRKSNLQKPAVQVLAAWSSLSFRLFCAPPSSCDLDPFTLHIWTVHSSTFSTNYSSDAIVNQVAKFDDYVSLLDFSQRGAVDGELPYRSEWQEQRRAKSKEGTTEETS